MPAGETSPLAAACGTSGGDDIGLGHVCSPFDFVGWGLKVGPDLRGGPGFSQSIN
jgi:hypothetical protein